MKWLKQSTAVTIKMGPFIDDTDFKTAETGLTITQADVRLSKNAGNMAQKSETTALTHDEIGFYDCLLNTTDTDTLGRLRVMVLETGSLSVWEDFMVLPANVFDSLVSGSDNLEVDDRDGAAIGTAANLATVDTVVDAIKVVTDALPNSGALTDIDTGINNIEAKLPTNFIMGSSDATDKDDDIDAILVDTADMQGSGVKLNATGKTDVNTEVDTGLSDINLDHLMKVAVLGTDVIDDSVIAKLVSSSATADFDDFVNTTDSLQALRDVVLTTDIHKDRFNMPATTTSVIGGKEVHTQIKYGVTNQVVVDYTYDPADGSLLTGTVA